jgi:starch synthase (maltosyl-transferring)
MPSAVRKKNAGVVGGRESRTSSGVLYKICHLTPQSATSTHLETLIGGLADRGFSHVCIGGLFESASPGLVLDHERSAFDGLPSFTVIERLRRACERRGIALALDLTLDRIAAGGATADALGSAYLVAPGLSALDPRQPASALHTARLQAGAVDRAAHWWADRLDAFERAGASAFRLTGLGGVPPSFARTMTGLRKGTAGLFAWTPGMDWSRHADLAGCGLAAAFASTCWWDGRSPWYAEEIDSLSRVAPVVGAATPPGDAEGNGQGNGEGKAADDAALERHLMLAAATTGGLFVAADRIGAACGGKGGTEALARAIALADRLAPRKLRGGLRPLTGPGAPVTLAMRTDQTGRGIAILCNADRKVHAAPTASGALPPTAGAAVAVCGEGPRHLAPGEVAVVDVAPTEPIVSASSKEAVRRSAEEAARQSPLAIDDVQPTVTGGPFAAKHIVGRPLRIEADILADGHDQLAAEVVWWPEDDPKAREAVPLVPLGNDRWRATLTPSRIGRHLFSVTAWRDEWGSLIHGLELKHRAGVDIAVEREEAARFLEALVGGDDKDGDGKPEKGEFAKLARQAREATADAAVALLATERMQAAVARHAVRRFRTEAGPHAVDVERPQAEFAAWYELFPRSLTDNPARHGTFDDVIAALPRVRAMGFDVLYFPPIHPIGQAHRKGRNNSLSAGPDDVGSPYAIGAAEGGHDAIHPALGSFADFRRLTAAARAQGLEIAIDFAIQCSPDHPWLREHPGWFRRRPDGTIKYAENPPKKYEDIVNVDFHADAAVPDLWLALRDVVLLWVGEGVRLFRVDNPHTKPLPFWQWLIGDVRARHPDAIFLAEAFTRPKMMHRLAKVGFSQSYTYFTWRNGKNEIADYLRELASPPVVDFFRPHFFVNTPDINPFFLQTSGRPGFLIRAALAATLSGLWGVYSGFELCEAAALPGREEYLDSEKYEIRPRDFGAPGNIVAEIALLNRLRRAHPALQTHRDVAFYNAFNDQVLLYGKRAPGADDMILVAVSLDPHNAQEADFELPLWEWRLPDDGALAVEDLVRGGSAAWRGKHQRLRLDPAMPFAIWRLSPGAAT